MEGAVNGKKKKEEEMVSFEVVQEEKKRVQQEYQAFVDSGANTDSEEFRILRKRIYEINSRCQQYENQQFHEMMSQPNDNEPGSSLSADSRHRRGGV